jgi:hypothetical protein
LRGSSKSKGRRNAETLDQEQEGFSERLILRGPADLWPIQLLSYGTHHQQGSLEIAVVFTERLKLGDHDRSGRQHRYPDAQNLVFLGGVEQRLCDRHAAQPMQYID